MGKKISKTRTDTNCTLLTYKQPGNILSRKPFEKSKKTEKFLMQMKKNCTASSSLWEHREAGKGDFIPNEHLASASACLKWLTYLPEASKCPFVATNLNDHPIMLVLVWQTIFVFKIQKIIKMLKTWTMFIKSFITGNNRKNQGIKKETKTSKKCKIPRKEKNKATPFVILAFWFTPLISMLC